MEAGNKQNVRWKFRSDYFLLLLLMGTYVEREDGELFKVTYIPN
jgi:hypothetical protein